MFVGVDGCKAGWVAIALNDDDTFKCSVFKTIREVYEEFHEANLLLIDIPIGLKESGTEERTCDKKARRILGQPRGSSVFPVPCRQAVYSESQATATQINREITGRGLSKQSLGILPKIKEVDEFLREHDIVGRQFREVHPELCFHALARHSMVHNKKSTAGINERLEVLQRRYHKSWEIFEYARTQHPHNLVKKDDILDAMVAAIIARHAHNGHSISIPEQAEFDTRGLRMEMVYAQLLSADQLG